MMKLYYAETPHGRKACAVAAYLGIELDFERVDLAGGAHNQPAYLAINPMGQVPTLVVGSDYLSESNAIAIRLANEVRSDFWPKGRVQAHAQRWLSWDSEHFKPVVATYFVENALKPLFGEKTDMSALAQAEAAFPKVARILDDALKDRDFILGSRPTIADFALATFLPFAAASRLTFETYPEIMRWNAGLNSLPGYLDPYPKGA
ncbi:glutathione S-transferase family protein [Anianabacter salinae]|uniref:glutathione S-transferase family protein n=1 Tax=Anianabacter salinae TaxID=2851023 RepID=UPI00225E0D8D|nr:glutathione S-transferase family protein [Anianabacter salinae]MBV0912190.1 glutathione S-transferase family protein [Anianabacter salinae]